MTRVLTTRRVAGAALCVLGLALLTWSASAALGLATTESEAAPTFTPAATHATRGGVTTARLNVESVLADREASVDLPALPLGAILPKASGADTGALPLGTRVDILLETGPSSADASPARTEGSRVSAQNVVALQGASLAVGAAAFTLAGLLTYFWSSVKVWGFRLAILPALPLYARITRAEVFDNSVRERIFAAIKAHPGLSASDLAKSAGVAWGTTIYHLDVLEQNRMVSSLRSGRHRRYFENGAALSAPKEAVALLQNAVTANVATSIRGAPGTTQKELAGRVGLTPQALHWHLRRLVEAGLVRKQREGRVVRHFSLN